MTNFEKMKPALDMIFNDWNIDEFVEFLDDTFYYGYDCSECALQERCNRMGGFATPPVDKDDFVEGLTLCKDVLRSFLEEEVKE